MKNIITLSLILLVLSFAVLPCSSQAAEVASTASHYAGSKDNPLTQVLWPMPRFTDNKNGTVTDHLTGLNWLKNADCFGGQPWEKALDAAKNLSSGQCGLKDGSVAGQWRLPGVLELRSLVEANSSLDNIKLNFSDVKTASYWSSNTVVNVKDRAWYVYMYSGAEDFDDCPTNFHVWPVRNK